MSADQDNVELDPEAHDHADNEKVMVPMWVVDITAKDGVPDYPAAILLAQLLWWAQPGANGQPKLKYRKRRRFKDPATGAVTHGPNHLWLVHTDEQWHKATRLTPWLLKATKRRLEAMGLIERIRVQRSPSVVSACRPVMERVQELFDARPRWESEHPTGSARSHPTGSARSHPTLSKSPEVKALKENPDLSHDEASATRDASESETREMGDTDSTTKNFDLLSSTRSSSSSSRENAKTRESENANASRENATRTISRSARNANNSGAWPTSEKILAKVATELGTRDAQPRLDDGMVEHPRGYLRTCIASRLRDLRADPEWTGYADDLLRDRIDDDEPVDVAALVAEVVQAVTTHECEDCRGEGMVPYRYADGSPAPHGPCPTCRPHDIESWTQTQARAS